MKKLFTAQSLLFLTFCCVGSVYGQGSVLEVKVEQPGELRSIVGDKLLTATSISVTGTIGEEDFTTLRDMTYQGMLQSVDLTAAITADATLPAYAFYDSTKPRDASHLTAITLPECKSIGEYAFAYTPIKSVTLPSSLQVLGEGAFMECNELSITNESFGEVSVIPDFCFKGCKGFYNPVDSDGLTSIGTQAFMGCDLEMFFISESITEVGDEAFAQTRIIMHSVNTIPTIIVRGAPTFGKGVFKECVVNILSFMQPIAVFPDSFAADMPDIQELNFDYSQEADCTIRENAFTGYAGSELFLPKGLTEVYDNAFSNSNIELLYIPASATTLGEMAFYTNKDMKKVACEASEPPIAANAFNPEKIAQCTLLIPIGSSQAYKQAPGWKNFFNYVETDDFSHKTLSTPQIASGDFTVTPSKGSITLHSGVGAIGRYLVYGLDGSVIHSGSSPASTLSLSVAPGAYIVVADSATAKVLVN